MAVEFFSPKDQYNAGETIGHSIALKDGNIKALVASYEKSGVLENSAMVQEVSQELNSPMEEAAVQVEPEVVTEQAINPLDNAIEAAETATIEEPTMVSETAPVENPIQDIQPTENVAPVEQTPVDAQPIIEEQPVVISEAPVVDMTPQMPAVDINPEMAIQDAPAAVTEQPVVESAPMDIQPEISQNVIQPDTMVAPSVEPTTQNNNMGLNDIRTALNSALVAVDQLEKMQAEMEAKLMVANQAFENAQNINPMVDANVQQEEGQSLSLAA